MASVMVCEAQGVWLDRWRYEEAESRYFSAQFGCGTKPSQSSQSSSLVSEIAKARQHIQQSLTDVSSGTGDDTLASRLKSLELENSDMRKVTDDLQAVVKKLEQRIAALECTGASSGNKPVAVSAEKPVEDEDDDDDIDLFGSDDEVDEEAERIKEERLKAYAAKKSKKPTLIAKSNVILDVKPWDDETDMGEVERLVRTIEMPGLLWGTAKLVPVGYGIKKLTISCVVEDDKVSIDDLEELITGFEDFVQSVDIAAFNKI